MTVVVTGASSGIGKAVAIELHRRGIQAVLSGRNKERLSRASENCGGCKWVAGDVSKPEIAERLFDGLPEGRVCAVFAAGVADFGPTLTFENEKWDDAISANLSAMYHCCKAAISAMLA